MNKIFLSIFLFFLIGCSSNSDVPAGIEQGAQTIIPIKHWVIPSSNTNSRYNIDIYEIEIDSQIYLVTNQFREAQLLKK